MLGIFMLLSMLVLSRQLSSTPSPTPLTPIFVPTFTAPSSTHLATPTNSAIPTNSALKPSHDL